MSMFRFNPDDHTYWLGNRRLPSVTEVVSRVAPHRDVDDWYLHRGTAVHTAIQLELKGELDWSTVDERIKGRVEASMAFLRDAKIELTLVEAPLFSRSYQFAGTVDAYSVCRTIIDWKGSLAPQVVPQLGGYALLLEEDTRAPSTAVAVETHDDGTYKCQWLTAADFRRAKSTFLGLLTTFNWLEDNFPQKTQYHE